MLLRSLWMPWSRTLVLSSVLGLVACGGVSRPKPAELSNVPATQRVEALWSISIGSLRAPMVPSWTTRGTIVLATDNSEVLVLQASDGKVIERVELNQPLSAGVGSDGNRHALVTRNNELMVISQGKLAWRAPLTAQVFTPPLVAGERVFVLMADRTVQAFDGATGRSLWTQFRAGEPLILRQAGTLMAYQNTLIAGLSGRLTGFDPTTGQIRFDALLAAARGLNDLERMVDIVGLSSRSDPFICARAYLSQVGCIDATRGQVIWSRAAQGDRALTGCGGAQDRPRRLLLARPDRAAPVLLRDALLLDRGPADGVERAAPRWHRGRAAALRSRGDRTHAPRDAGGHRRTR